MEGTGAGDARQGARDDRPGPVPRRADVPLECDLVMKGGITSGVVYPLALSQLARTYRFRCVGGSSAGAIAAAAAAAAEYGRDTGAFERLEELPSQIAPVLPELFQPGPHSTVAHEAVMNLVEPGTSTGRKARRVLRCVLAAQRGSFVTAWGTGAVMAMVVALLGVGLDGFRAGDVAGGLVVFAVLALVAAVVAGAWAVVAEARTTWSGLAKQGFGVCVGSAGRQAPTSPADTPEGRGPGQLTDWLADRIDEVAGVQGPLTFGDLEERGISLRVMTTDLTHGRPMTFPFADRRFLFDPYELGDYFPPRVVERMVAGRSPVTVRRTGDVLRSPAGRPLYRLPEGRDIPVVVAARLSLSFPGLISAVPLYAIDYSRKDPADRLPVRCWFSDGGITSNFPIHFFDSLWPGRPTFALDLRPYGRDDPDTHVFYGGTGSRPPRVKPIDSVGAFGRAILDTMQYWADDAQAMLPGYRDRVVEVRLRPEEGGMNLRMPPEVVLALAGKGRAAADLLVDQFDFDQHRWTRYLTSMAELQQVLAAMLDRYRGPLPGGAVGYADLLNEAADRSPFRRDSLWSAAAAIRTESLLAFARGSVPDFTDHSPRPDPSLRITPQF